jgi:hypothetical protein
MTFIQKHKLACGKFKSAAGFPVVIDYQYNGIDKIVGVVYFGQYDMPIEWDINGKPLQLPLHQGLNLVPLREVTSYEVIPKEDQL